MAKSFTRREVITSAAATLAGGLLAGRATADPASGPQVGAAGTGERKRVLRFAHLTDSHVQPELRAGEGLTACFRHVLNHADKPELMVHGGDHIMSAFGADAARTKVQWDLYKSIVNTEVAIPIESCIGNHDIWGWNKAQSGTSGSEPNYGKKWAQDVLGLSAPYRTFERAGWRFIILDSVQPDGDFFRGELDAPQFDWLKEQFVRTPRDMHVIIVSHIPILSSTSFVVLPNAEESGREWKVPAAAMHIDARRIIALFDEHPNVRLCLSGHTHLLDRVTYNGVNYICDGTVCGARWKGPNQRCREGYGLIDLYNDGSFEHAYQSYGWKAEA